MKTVLVTGANKGIGLAVVEAILREQPQYKVMLGSRNIDRGQAARKSLLALDDSWSDRLALLQLDVGSDASVSEAAEVLTYAPPLYGLVNNAGLALGGLEAILNVNLYGVKRMCDVFAPLIESGGRIVNVTSASGPNYVARCDSKEQAFFTDAEVSWEQLERFIGDTGEVDSGYGFSKACANSYTMYLATRFPDLFINACTPGFIETDLGKDFLGDRTPQEAGMKTPAAGARVIMSLLFDPPRGTGHYYGSDALRSPLDSYRAPGSAEYTGH